MQQVADEPPQLEHAPEVQVPTGPQLVPDATQVVPAQQPPPAQVESAQHSSPGAPHGTKSPRPLQTMPASDDAPPGMHTPLAVSRHAPAAQTPFGQAGWSGPPHGPHTLAGLHERSGPLHVEPAQHGCPRPPHPAHWPVAVQRSPSRHAAPVATQVGLTPWSQQPVVQLAPAQQAWPTSPQGWHRPLRHEVPVPQASPAQHGWFGPPHAVHAPPEQTVPAAVQAWLAQQGWFAPPHATHCVPPWQTVWGAVQLGPAQQVWDGPPHDPQEPLVQVPPTGLGQLEPSVTQLFATQQPPLAQVLAAQQGWPGPPQLAHSPGWPTQVRSLAPHWRPGQHAWPGPPQTVQRLLRQAAPVGVQLPFAQQGCPTSPHATQELPTHAVPLAVHWLF